MANRNSTAVKQVERSTEEGLGKQENLLRLATTRSVLLVAGGAVALWLVARRRRSR